MIVQRPSTTFTGPYQTISITYQGRTRNTSGSCLVDGLPCHDLTCLLKLRSLPRAQRPLAQSVSSHLPIRIKKCADMNSHRNSVLYHCKPSNHNHTSWIDLSNIYNLLLRDHNRCGGNAGAILHLHRPVHNSGRGL